MLEVPKHVYTGYKDGTEDYRAHGLKSFCLSPPPCSQTLAVVAQPLRPAPEGAEGGPPLHDLQEAQLSQGLGQGRGVNMVAVDGMHCHAARHESVIYCGFIATGGRPYLSFDP